jgi:hypothetical protein
VRKYILPTTGAGATQRKRSQKEAKTTARVFSSTYMMPGLSFAAALSNRAEKPQQPQTRQIAEAAETTGVQEKASAPSQQKEAGQSVPAPNVNSDPLDMFRAVTVVQQITAEFKGAVSEEAKILAITRIVFNLMKENGK